MTPRIATTLIFSGAKPAASEASIPAITASNLSRLAISLNRSRRSVSRLIVRLFRPDARSGAARSASEMPLVVIAKVFSPGSAPSRSTISPMSRRAKGSPPVSLILSIPMPTKIPASLTISPSVNTSARGVQSMPCGGMQ